MWGPTEINVDRRVGLQHEGLLRVRRTLFIASGTVAALVVVVVIAGGTDSAAGIAVLLLAPLLFFLVVLQVLVMLTRPKQTQPRPDGS